MRGDLRPSRIIRRRHFRWETSETAAWRRSALNRPEQEESADLRELRGIARPVPRPRLRLGRARGRARPATGGNFCSGGDVFEIIEPLTRMAMPDLLAFTRMTGDLVKAMRKCPQPIIAAVDGVCAGAGAILAMASDLRLATPRGEDRVSVHAGRPGRRRHGRLRDSAAHHRPGPRGGAAVHRPLDDGRRRATPGASTMRLHPARGAARRKALELARSLADGPWFAHGMTKTMLNQEWAMGIDEMIESEAQAQAICMATRRFPPRLRSLRGQAQAGLRGRLNCHVRLARSRSDARASRLAVLRAEPSRAMRRELDAFAASGALADVDHRRCRRVLPQPRRARSERRACSTPVSPPPMATHRRIDSREACLARETLARHDGLADFAFAMQGLGSGAIGLAGSPELRARVPAEGAVRRMARRFRAVREGRGLRRRRHDLRGRARRRRLRARRREDLDLERRHRRRLLRLRPHRRGARRARHFRFRRRCRTIPDFSIAERIEVIAPHPLATLRFENCRVPREPDARRAGRGLQDRDAHARHLPRLGRGGGAGLRAARARRSARPRALAKNVRRDACRSATDAGGNRRDGDG